MSEAEATGEEREIIAAGKAAAAALLVADRHFEGLKAEAVKVWIETSPMEREKLGKMHLVAQTLDSIQKALHAAVAAGEQAAEVVNYRVVMAKTVGLRGE